MSLQSEEVPIQTLQESARDVLSLLSISTLDVICSELY